MIKSRTQVELVIYESEKLAEFKAKCKEHWSSVASEIATDLQWLQENDMFTWDGESGSFRIVCIERTVEEIIKVIDEVIEEYELEDYYA